ncbi:hypothetical protein J2W36_002969 [Variovorax ginsengisoli]|uniref:Uncharacterized protein n=1 Tax=Variovorax ginsengisoli TaxID=363844 RepID=A0ABT9S8M5_9BURK|nr:hypothetical protein [Variovorax ginsengisoli]
MSLRLACGLIGMSRATPSYELRLASGQFKINKVWTRVAEASGTACSGAIRGHLLPRTRSMAAQINAPNYSFQAPHAIGRPEAQG